MRRIGVVFVAICALVPAALGEVTIREIDWIEGHRLVVFENRILRATVAPAFGGRLVSLIYLPTGAENLHQVPLTELPDVDGPVKEARELMTKLVAPEYSDHWTLGGDVVFQEQPVWDFLSIGPTELWGWLECFVDRGYGHYQGNEHHVAVWEHKIVANEDEVGVETTYTTQLPPAPLAIRRRFTLREGESCVRVSHTITNVGEDEMRVEYYPHVCMTPGGAFDAADRFAVPIKGAGDIVSARIMPTFQEPGGCTKFVPAAPWVAYVDTAKKLLIVHGLGYQPIVGWNWNGRTMCSLEPVFTTTLAPGQARSWDDYMGITQGFTSISNVLGDVAVDIQATDNGSTIEVALTMASFAAQGDLEGTFTLTGAQGGVPAQSIPVKLPAQALSRKETMVIEKKNLPEGRYVARLEAGDGVVAAKVIDVPLVEAFPRTTEERPILWLARPYVAMPPYLEALCGIKSTLLRSTFVLDPKQLDIKKIAALAVSDVDLIALKAAQCKKIIDYVRSGGRFLVLPVGSACLSAPVLIPRPVHIIDFYKELGVGPALEGRRNPNQLVRRNFTADVSSVVDHPLTRGLDWSTFENDGLWRYAIGDHAQVLVRLDTGDPLLVVNKLGEGEVVVWCGPVNIYSLGWAQFGEQMDQLLVRIVGGDMGSIQESGDTSLRE